jgi:PAS domain S-box-containing protein
MTRVPGLTGRQAGGFGRGFGALIERTVLPVGLGCVAAGLIAAGIGLWQWRIGGTSDWAIVIAGAFGLTAAGFGAALLCLALRLRERAERLGEALGKLPDGFALWDKDDILVVANQGFYDHTSPLSAVPGEAFGDALARIAAAGDFPDISVANAEDYIRSRVHNHRHPAEPFERQHKSGRWVRVAEKRLESGGIVTLYSDITPQKAAQQAIARNEALLHRIIDTVPITVTLKNLDLRMTLWNKHAAALFGRNDDELLGRRLSEVVPSPESDLMEAVDREIIASGEAPPPREVTIDATGTRHRIWMTKLPLRGDAGQVESILSVGVDITGIRQAEREAAEHRRLLRQVIDALPVWVSIKDLELRYELMNKAQADMFRIDEADAIGKRVSEIKVRGVAPEFRKAQIEANEGRDRETIANGKPMLFVEEILKLSDGVEGHFSSSRMPLHDDRGHVAKLLTLTVDLTDLRRTEAELRESRELLLESQRLGRTGYTVSDVVKNRVYWSDSLFEMREVPKRPWFTFEESRAHSHPDDVAKVLREIDVAVAERRPFRVEHRVRRRDGTYGWEYMVGHPRVDAAGAYAGSIIFVQDITERKSIELALIEASRAKSEFLANMSHELRTPLNAVIGYAELISAELFGPVQPRYRGYANDILQSGRHLLDIIGDILDMSRIEAGEFKIELVETDLAPIVEASLRILRLRAESRNQVLAIAIPLDLPKIRVDNKAMRQVLLNLLGNAVKFTPPGGRIRLRAEPEPKWVRISISDTGPGIAREHLETVFQPFWRAGDAKTRNVEGTGLGLALSRKLVELHGGTLSLESTPGAGTIATIALPR